MDRERWQFLVDALGLEGAQLALEIYTDHAMSVLRRAQRSLAKGHLEKAQRLGHTLRLLSERVGAAAVADEALYLEEANDVGTALDFVADLKVATMMTRPFGLR